MRVDANVSVRPAGTETFGTRCEIKNLNSLRSLGRAIEYEARRQIDLLEAGERVRQETRHWDEDDGRTHTLRSKEEADDYRYFPEPDLVPLEPDDAWISRLAPRCPCCRPSAGRPRGGRRRRADDRRGRRRRRARPRRPRRSPRSRPAATRAGCSPTSSTTSPSTAPAALAPAALAAARAHRGRRRAHRHPGQDGAGRDGRSRARRPGDDRRRPKGFEAMDDGRARRQSSTRSSPPTPTSGSASATGDDKARGKLTGFFVGQVMKATKGKADGKAVTARLRELAG